MTLTQASKELGVSINTVYARIKDGTLRPLPVNPALKSRRFRFNRADIEALKQRLSPAPPAREE